MFIPNQTHLQKTLFSTVTTLPKKQLERLQNSWAETFYQDVFCQIDEKIFANLYSDKASRPNVPVNILVALEILKEGHGWTDEEMYNSYCYNIQLRFALGLYNLDEQPFEVRTVYNFRKRLTQHMQETGENLIEKLFETLTDAQMERYSVKSQTQRVDSKQLASNIRKTTRLQLLIEVVKRIYRILGIEEKERYEELFAPYQKGSSSQYIYQLKGQTHESHIQQIGQVIYKLLEELKENHGESAPYEILDRVFEEHFKLNDEVIEPKTGKELSASSLQSPDDLEASYRHKAKENYVGYVVNVTETIDEDEDGLQLITKIQTKPNTTEDATMLEDVIEDLKSRTDVETIYGDGAYHSEELEKKCKENDINLCQTAIRGASPKKAGLSDFAIKMDENGNPTNILCPHGHQVEIENGNKENRYIVRVPSQICPECAANDRRNKYGKEVPKERQCWILYFSRAQLNVALRRQRVRELRKSGKNPRAAVEATVHELSCRWNGGKVRVRGICRVAMTVANRVIMVNVRRIFRFKQAQKKANTGEQDKGQAESGSISHLWRTNGMATFLVWSNHRQTFPRPFSLMHVNYEQVR